MGTSTKEREQAKWLDLAGTSYKQNLLHCCDVNGCTDCSWPTLQSVHPFTEPARSQQEIICPYHHCAWMQAGEAARAVHCQYEQVSKCKLAPMGSRLYEYLHTHSCCSLQTPVGALVGVGMVHIVLDPPGLKGVKQWHEGEGAHNILHQVVLTKAAMTAVMSNNKELQHMRDSQAKLCSIRRELTPCSFLQNPSAQNAG